MNHNNIYSILGKLQGLEPKQQTEQTPEPQAIYESVEAKGSILEGVGAIEAKLKQKFQESGLQYYTGKKKYGKDGMAALAKAGREGANQEELGRIKDKFIKKEDASVCKECGMTEGSCGHTKMEEGTCAKCGMADCKCDHTKTEEKTTHKGGEVSHKDGVTRHTKKDYPGYQSDSDEDDNKDDEPRKAGRPRKHAKKADTGEKKGRGRPKKEKAPEYDKRHDPFGRVKTGAEKSGEKGKKVAGKAMSGSLEEKAVSQQQQKFMGMVHAMQKGAKIKGASPELKKVAHGMKKSDARDFAATKHAGLPKRVNEGINFAEMLKEKHATVDEMLSELSNDIKLFKETGHCSELLRDCMDLRGYAVKKMAEVAQVPSNPDPFHAVKPAVPSAKGIPGNLPPAQVPGKERLLKGKGPEFFGTGQPMDEIAMEEELNELARLAGLGEVSRGEYIKQQDAKAEKSGKDKFQAFGQTFDTDEISEEPNEGNAFTGKLAATKKGDKFELDGKEFTDTSSLEEEKIDVKDAPEAKNKPKPKYASIKSITTQGDDMHRQKSQYPGAAAKGDNPLTNEKVKTLEDKLTAEYESIKKSVK